ncbi:unnamed protein product [Ilex paraguariensis]|uniref:ATP-dependent helicase C-terminal domain-containing protein n=1 Tax=Ilex paraguariensis TaxID=185542 RepID=A0ABC8UDM2_9AQUA
MRIGRDRKGSKAEEVQNKEEESWRREVNSDDVKWAGFELCGWVNLQCRCIRHRFDYGAIILLDERFREERNVACISKWLRKSIRQYDSFDESLEGLKSFFIDVKERVSKTANNLQSPCVNIEEIPSVDPSKPRKKNQKANKSSLFREKLEPNSSPTIEKPGPICHPLPVVTKYNSSFTQTDSEVQALVSTNEKHIGGCVEFTGLECDFEKQSR